jgi:hypothetical protein
LDKPLVTSMIGNSGRLVVRRKTCGLTTNLSGEEKLCTKGTASAAINFSALDGFSR